VIPFLGGCTCAGSSLACSCSPRYTERKRLDYSGHQPEDLDQDKSKRKL
jgi:hypothetical protein